MSAYSINMGNNGKVYSLASIVAVESDIEPKFVTEVTWAFISVINLHILKR